MYPAADIVDKSDHESISSGDPAGQDDSDNIFNISALTDIEAFYNDVSSIASGHDSDSSTKELVSLGTQAAKTKLEQHCELEVNRL